jgi:hypothetical protein
MQAEGAQPLAEMPAWTLADDDSGLEALLRSQVLLSPQHESVSDMRPQSICHRPVLLPQ